VRANRLLDTRWKPSLPCRIVVVAVIVMLAVMGL
jgi:hypothetical protein